MMTTFDHINDLPMSSQESAWLHDRMETLSVRESVIFSAEMLRKPPKCGADIINHLIDLSDYKLCSPAGSYEQLGRFYLKHENLVPKDLQEFINMEQLGQYYEDTHPGIFIGDTYVQYPNRRYSTQYDGTNLEKMLDEDWSVKLKLASERNPDGVWLRLPDYSELDDEGPGEIRLALDALGVKSVDECTLLEARCILPEIRDLAEQYDDLEKLVDEGQSLGFALDERGQGKPYFMETFAAALEYENCHRLDFALDISQNQNCYNWVPSDNLQDLAKRVMRDQGMSQDILVSGCVDLDAFAENLLEQEGYILTRDESAYIGRNERQFTREHSLEALPGMVLE